jgi:hypothetical protein
MMEPFVERKQTPENLDESVDIRAYDEAKTLPSDPIPFEEALKMLERGEEV